MKGFDGISGDVRFGLRMLRQAPLFSVVAILTLGIGIGANTAIFSLVNQALLQPLSYPESNRIVVVWGANPERGWSRSGVSSQDFLDWKEQSAAFASIAAFDTGSTNLSGGSRPERIEYAAVDAGFFDVMGMQPAIGRVFTHDEDRPGEENVVLLSHGFWKRAFSSDITIAGRTLMLDGEPHRVLGVMPEGFSFPSTETSVWKPLAIVPDDPRGMRGSRWLSCIARISDDATTEAAQADISTIANRLALSYPDTNTGWDVELVPLHRAETTDLRGTLIILWGAVGFVLLIACVNVSNLLLARAVARKKEISIRGAIGAGRFRLVRQLLTESLLLALAGSSLGVIIAFWGLDLLQFISPPGTWSRLESAGIDQRVLGFSLCLACFTCLLFGLLPAWRASRSDILDGLKKSTVLGPTGRARHLNSLLVISELSLALVLLVGAALTIQSFSRMMSVEPGFEARGLLTLRVAPPYILPSEEGDFERLLALAAQKRTAAADFYDRLLENVANLPGVESVSTINRLPLTGNWWYTEFFVSGRPLPTPGSEPGAYSRVITEGYFRTMGIPLLRGRTITSEDRENTPPVVVINMTMAARYWPGSDPVGDRITFWNPGGEFVKWYTIAGIVGDTHHSSVDVPPGPMVYVPFRQAMFGHFGNWGQTLVIRTTGESQGLVPSIQERARALDPGLPVYAVRNMEELVADSTAASRLVGVLMSAFAIVALLLSSIGVYGVVSWTTSRRVREIGLRMALGARRRDVLLLISSFGLRLALAGVVAGVAVSLALTRVLSSLLFEISPTDPVTLLVTASVLIAAASLAVYIPARRASRIDPFRALRTES